MESEQSILMAHRKIYVASSWRNQYYPGVVQLLRSLNHEVYDFRNPQAGFVHEGSRGTGTAFQWSDIDVEWDTWTPNGYKAALDHPLAKAGFASDFGAMQWADTCVLIMPAGRSASWEAGWMQGAGKECFLYLPEPIEPELMFSSMTILADMDHLIQAFTTDVLH